MDAGPRLRTCVMPMSTLPDAPTCHRTIQRRGYTSRAGYAQIDAVMRECAELYNAALQERRDAYRLRGASVTLYAQQCQFTGVRADRPETWGARDANVGRGVLRRLDRAYQAFFRRVKAGEKPGFPRWKSGRRWRTIELAEVRPGMVRDGVVRVKGLPPIRVDTRGSLPPSSQLRSLRITRRFRRLIVALGYEVPIAPLAPGRPAVGIDMGVTDRLMLSTGEAIPGERGNWDAVQVAQRRLSRCRAPDRRKGIRPSREWKRRKAALANLRDRERVAARNRDHRLTTDLTRRFGWIVIEDLAPHNMTRSAKGTAEEPGANVAAKSGLNRRMLDQRIGQVRRQLTYKAASAGGQVVAVDPRYTSQTCSGCGNRAAAQRREKRFQCTACGLRLDADHNAARNILRLGLTLGGVEKGDERSKGVASPHGSTVVPTARLNGRGPAASEPVAMPP